MLDDLLQKAGEAMASDSSEIFCGNGIVRHLHCARKPWLRTSGAHPAELKKQYDATEVES